MSDVVAYVVAKGKRELSRRVVRVDGDGDDVVEVPDGEAGESVAVTFTLTPELAAAVEDGSTDVSVGFMRGEIKMAGDTGALLRVLPALRRAATP